jgi:hypothetical protein
MAKIRFPVFQDNHGNAFIFPMVNDKSMDIFDLNQFSIDASLALAVVRINDLMIEPDADGNLDFEHVITRAQSPNIDDGSVPIYLIAGPVFEEVKNDG